MERTAQIFEDLLNHRIAEGTLIKAGQELAMWIKPATAAVKEQLHQAAVLQPMNRDCGSKGNYIGCMWRRRSN